MRAKTARRGGTIRSGGVMAAPVLSDRSSPYPSSPARRKEEGDESGAEEAMILQQQGVVAAAPSKHPADPDEANTYPARWAAVEPWSSLLQLSGHTRGGEDDEILQDRKLVEVLLGGQEESVTILQDVARTRSDTAAFRGEKARQWLARSVSLFCRERSLRYTQGLTQLAAPWALITDPPCLNDFSYRCFCAFVDRFAPNMFATTSDEARMGGERGTFVVLEAHLLLFEQLLWFHDPALAAQMDKCCVSPAVYATPWFVTLFARQTPAPVLLYLWRRMLEYGDPVLHQFLALAWLLSNRRILLETPLEDVPETVTRLRLQSAEVVDSVFGAAVTLRETTPRLFCDVTRRACFADDGAVVEGSPAATADTAAAWSGEEQGAAETDQSESGGSAITTKLRVSWLEGLRRKGVLLVGADQVAEIIIAHPSTPPPATAAPASTAPGNEEDVRYWGSATSGGRFVLVDCRTQQEKTAAVSEEDSRSHEVVTGSGQVLWRRIHPADSFGRESAAVEEVLREVGTVVVEGDAPLGVVGTSDSFSCSLGAVEQGSVQGIVGISVTAPYCGGAHANGLAHLRKGDGHAGSSGSDNGGVGIREMNASVRIKTHVCFIGTGGHGGSSDGDRSSFASTEAVAAAAEAPEFRLARAASRSCLTAHVCVLQGGFSALDEALYRRGSANGRDVSGIGRDDSNGPSACVDRSPYGLQVENSLLEGPDVSSVVEAATVGGAGVGRSAATAGARGGSSPTSTETGSGKPFSATPPSPASSGGGGGAVGRGGGAPVPAAPFSAFSQGLERKTIRLAGNRRISEPFRLYAARSADEMGRALRSLPLAASKPLEDAARVCNSLAKTNVRALGDSRLSVSRTVMQLEKLNARMDSTTRGFAKYFGAGWYPQEGKST